jgi:hypothetical protein
MQARTATSSDHVLGVRSAESTMRGARARETLWKDWSGSSRFAPSVAAIAIIGSSPSTIALQPEDEDSTDEPAQPEVAPGSFTRYGSACARLRARIARARAERTVPRRATETRIAVGFAGAAQLAIGTARRERSAAERVFALRGVTRVRAARRDACELPRTVLTNVVSLPRVAARATAMRGRLGASRHGRNRVLAVR